MEPHKKWQKNTYYTLDKCIKRVEQRKWILSVRPLGEGQILFIHIQGQLSITGAATENEY